MLRLVGAGVFGRDPLMLCAACGLSLPGDVALCPHHGAEMDSNWAKANKIWNDYFHRGVPIVRVADAIDPIYPPPDQTNCGVWD